MQRQALLSVGYKTSAKVFVLGMGGVGCILFLLALIYDQSEFPLEYQVLVIGLALFAAAAISDMLVRHVWIFPDRVVHRDLFFKMKTIKFSEVHDLIVGVHEVVVQSESDVIIRIPKKIEKIDEVTAQIYDGYLTHKL